MYSDRKTSVVTWGLVGRGWGEEQETAKKHRIFGGGMDMFITLTVLKVSQMTMLNSSNHILQIHEVTM